MWKFLNVSKPEAKKRKTSDELRESQNDDKNKRERKFKDSWQKEFPWLLYDQNHGLMYCKPCRSTFSSLSKSKVKQSISIPDKYSKYVGGPFVNGGCKNFKHDSNSNSNSNSTFIALNLYLMIDSKTQKAKIRDRNR